MTRERPLVMTPEQVAIRWQCSPSHVRREIAAARLPAFRLGGKLLRIRVSDVEHYECAVHVAQHGRVGQQVTQFRFEMA